MSDTITKPSLYVGTYGKYNNGSIEGKWLNLEDYADAKAFWTACEELHKDEADPEFMFQDFEGFPKSMYSEAMNTEEIEKLIEFAKLDEEEQTLVTEYEDATGSMPDSLEDAQDAYEMQLTEFNREREYGEYVADNFFTIPDELASYIDYEAIGRDALMDCSISDNGHVFRSI